MNIYTVLSPDKISISMFSSFLKGIYGDNLSLLDMNDILSFDLKNDIIKSLIDKYQNTQKDFVIRYKLRTRINTLDPQAILKNLPENILSNSKYIILFDLYSQKPIILKDEESSLSSIVERWEKYLEALK